MKIVTLGLFALALGLAAPAHAGDSEDFAGCDGLKKPKSKDDGMRGVATVSRFGGLSFGGSKLSQTVAACDRALANPKLLPAQAVRRAHLLRARAAAKLQLGQHDGALADLDAAQAALSFTTQDAFFRRSMGVSLDMLRALALAQLGRDAEASALAASAAAQRPYAVQVQMAAAAIEVQLRAPGTPPGPAYANLVKLEPAARQSLVGQAIAGGDFAGAVRLAADNPLTWPDMSLPMPAGLAGLAGAADPTERLTAIVGAFAQGMQLAYAHAATGDAAGARAQVDGMRAKLAAARAAQMFPPLVQLIDTKIVTPVAGQVEARIALAEGRTDQAAALLADPALPSDPLTNDLRQAYRAKEPAGDALPPTTATAASAATKAPRNLAGLADMLLIHPETARTVIDYQKARPNILGAVVGAAFSMGTSLLGGVERTAGFRSVPQANGAVMIEYTGNTTSAPMVQEMTLLRAAEMAREAGKSHFTVEGRKDYQRYLVATQYNIEQSRTLSGYKTELTVRFGDVAPGMAATGFDAVAVIDALGPLYYEAPKAKAKRS